ncbi:PP2C family protein-serine/threonine phosphatase [Palleronia sp. KMU-117]|uniref:PP2C family protein-serine/threonine phosphatase n=1 Tax=Palleronia sp. KMU-117 TaxID=3434108 RepID=UPI003D70BE70
MHAKTATSSRHAHLPAPAAGPAITPGAGTMRRVLVVDDSRVQRKILASLLGQWGYEVTEAASAEAALDLCRSKLPDLILSDWMMPGKSGLDLCEAIRALAGDSYPYFILLTSRGDKADIAHGLGRGADDFLTKPVNAAELRARLTAGERILAMHGVVTERNRQLNATLGQLETIQRDLDRDLQEARRLQQSLVPRRFHEFDGATVSLLLRPAGHIGGDLVGVFPAGTGRIGFFGIDVAGHGIASALMTARLAGYFSGESPDRNLALARDPGGAPAMRPPDQLCEMLNRMLVDDVETGQYFTLLVGELDLASGRVRMVQAGHPPPLVQRRTGATEFVGNGGLPIGLVEGARYRSIELVLGVGDRLLVHSDGITECPGLAGATLDDDGLAVIAARNAMLRGPAFLEAMVWDLTDHAGGPDFADDVSAVLIERSNPAPGKV